MECKNFRANMVKWMTFQLDKELKDEMFTHSQACEECETQFNNLSDFEQSIYERLMRPVDARLPQTRD